LANPKVDRYEALEQKRLATVSVESVDASSAMTNAYCLPLPENDSLIDLRVRSMSFSEFLVAIATTTPDFMAELLTQPRKQWAPGLEPALNQGRPLDLEQHPEVQALARRLGCSWP